ncbi:unnamed protein product [Rhizophagus irregularis]|uniref:Uncharacterized protein n=2 Tax=Rhizophagus irregularis TaxID=588596 RepID=A0A915ZU48_9GLOM|nr:unnamed protein product [Rhizophagus irregularis]
MARSDKKNRTCDRCGKECANPNKLREHLNRKFKCKPKPVQQKSPERQPPPRPRSPSPAPAPIVHTKGKDRRREKPQMVNPTPVPELEPQMITPTPVLETESQRGAPVLGRDYITENEAKNWVNPNARRPKEHFRAWGKRLVQRWKELDLGDHDIPVNLDECLSVCHDLEQYDPDAVRPPTLKELEAIHREGKFLNVDELQVAQDYITEEKAKNWVNPNARKHKEHFRTWGTRLLQRWKELNLGDHDIPESLEECLILCQDLERYDLKTVRPPTLKELEEHQKREAGPGLATQANRKKERKIIVPITAVDIHFEESPVGRDLERPHQNRSLMSKWVGIVPHPEENPAYAFNVPVFGHEYAEAPYIPKLISASRPKIKEVLQTELHRKDQIKSAIVVKCLYLLTKKDKEEREDSDDFANKVYKVKYHRGEMRPILLEGI